MNLKHLKKELFTKGNAVNACDSVMHLIKKAGSLTELFLIYWQNACFCVGNNFPSPQLLKYELQKECNAHDIFVDQVVTLQYPGKRAKAVFLGHCRATVYADAALTRLFARQSSEVTIYAAPYTNVIIDVFDQASVNVVRATNAKVTVFKIEGGSVKGDNVRVIEKSFKEYLKNI